MKKILLLSDTHSHIDETILKYVKLSDEVWHAGDIGDLKVTDTIKKLKPLRAVFGNIDNHEARLEFPLNNRFFCEGVEVLLTHIGGYPGKYSPAIREEITKNPPKLFICGHSHILKVMFDKKLNSFLILSKALLEVILTSFISKIVILSINSPQEMGTRGV